MIEENKTNETVDETPVEQQPTEQETTEKEPELTQEDVRAAAIDEMEKASQKALDAMRENGNDKNEEVVDEAKDQLEEYFSEFKAWLENNKHPEQLKKEMKDMSDKVSALLEKTRQTVIDVSNNEQFKKTMESGREFLVGTGAMIADGLQFGYEKLKEIPQFKAATEFVDGQIEELRKSEKLKNIVDKSEEGFNHASNAIFSGLKSFFKTDEADSDAKEDQLPELPE